MEHNTEIPKLSPTEASKGFLNKWRNEILFGLDSINLSVWASLAAVDIASGNTTGALIKGIAAGCFGLATVLYGSSIVMEKISLRKKIDQLKNQSQE